MQQPVTTCYHFPTRDLEATWWGCCIRDVLLEFSRLSVPNPRKWKKQGKSRCACLRRTHASLPTTARYRRLCRCIVRTHAWKSQLKITSQSRRQVLHLIALGRVLVTVCQGLMFDSSLGPAKSPRYQALPLIDSLHASSSLYWLPLDWLLPSFVFASNLYANLMLISCKFYKAPETCAVFVGFLWHGHR